MADITQISFVTLSMTAAFTFTEIEAFYSYQYKYAEFS